MSKKRCIYCGHRGNSVKNYVAQAKPEVKLVRLCPACKASYNGHLMGEYKFPRQREAAR